MSSRLIDMMAKNIKKNITQVVIKPELSFKQKVKGSFREDTWSGYQWSMAYTDDSSLVWQLWLPDWGQAETLAAMI